MSHGPLLESLKDEAACLEQLLQQLRTQQAALVAGNSAELSQASQLAEAQMQALQSATARRVDVQSAFETLDAAAESAPDLRSRTQIKAFLAQLRNGCQALIELHQRNSALAEQGLQLVDATLSSFVQLQQQGQPAVYGARGNDATQWQSERSMCDFNA